LRDEPFDGASALFPWGRGKERWSAFANCITQRLVCCQRRMWPAKNKLGQPDSDGAPAPSRSTEDTLEGRGDVQNGFHDMNFDLEEIRAVFFRCNACNTAVNFPRIRWANLPERCPNCGAPWMKEPTSEFNFPEENLTRAFKAVRAFRDALQALISVSRSIAFTIGFETGETGDAEETAAKQAGSPSS
jgi:hypothetical protein